ncbi:hypothetical protein ACTPC6_00295 [Clostridioides difficile]
MCRKIFFILNFDGIIQKVVESNGSIEIARKIKNNKILNIYRTWASRLVQY